MNSPNYEVDDPEAKALLRSISGKIGGSLKSGWGFMLMLFEFHGKANFYASSADREDVIKMLLEWIAKQSEGGLNPNHPMTKTMTGNWHKLCAVLVHMLGDNVVITPADIDALGRDGVPNISVDDRDGVLTLRCVSSDEAQRLVAREDAILRSKDI